jgi:hypothetical protein
MCEIFVKKKKKKNQHSQGRVVCELKQISDFIDGICMGGGGGWGMLQLKPVKKYLVRINYASKKICFGKHIDFKHELICPYESQYSFIRGFLRFPKFTMS